MKKYHDNIPIFHRRNIHPVALHSFCSKMVTQRRSNHRCTAGATLIIALLSLLLATCSGFSNPALAVITRQQQRQQRQPSRFSARRGRVNPKHWHPSVTGAGRRLWMGESSSSSEPRKGIIQKILFRCNASTKWIVTLINTVALWSRPHRFEGPWIVFGSIVAVYFTNFLKSVINQNRPSGAPFADPGMPSSHSLTCFFAATAWNASPIVVSFELKALAWFGAFVVAWLRVVCGYHSWAQVGVGAGLGSLLGSVWVTFGEYLYRQYPTATFGVSWGLYISGATLFISTKMKDWITHERNL